ncbi:MAG: gamma-glutamylcyclotransferase family protein [Rhodospirillaceae bacterium]|nr:gamma-glutamylcyclotransferase family protein [Rhodospirillaceae bacterium]
MLYFAYGSNLNLRGMTRRCPAAEPLCVARLPGYKLCFRTYTDIEPQNGGEVHGALYKLTPACVRALDAFEGPAYAKITVSVIANARTLKAMAYAMAEKAPLAPPSMEFYREVAHGYRDWKLDEALLRRARYDTLQTGHAPAAQDAPGAQPRRTRRAMWDPAADPTGEVGLPLVRKRGPRPE